MVTRRITFSFIIFVVIAACGMMSLIYLLYDLQNEFSKQKPSFPEDIVLQARQVERQARAFQHDLILYSIGDYQVSRDELIGRYDALRSKFENVGQGELAEMYAALESAPAALSHGKKMLGVVDPLIRNISVGDTETRQRVNDYFDQVIDSIFTVSIYASEFALYQREEKRKAFERAGKITLLLVFALLLSGSALFAILLRNQFRLDELTQHLEEKVQERAMLLQESNQRLKTMSQAIEQSPISVVICNLRGDIEYVNPRFVEVTGYSFQESIGRNPRFLQSGRTSRKTYEKMWQKVHSGKVWQGEICNRKKNGDLFWEHVSLSPIRDEDDELIGYLAVKEDISKRKLQEELLIRQANYDSLTGLPNRLLAMDRLKQATLQAQRRGDRVALLFVDLDNFKQINDTLGHDSGDLVLREASERFLNCLRHCDTAARFGGDEFIIILSELQEVEDVKPILDRIVNTFSFPFDLGGKRFLTTTSIGVSFYPDDGENPNELLKKSDSAMYLAKRKGKSNYRFYRKNMEC